MWAGAWLENYTHVTPYARTGSAAVARLGRAAKFGASPPTSPPAMFPLQVNITFPYPSHAGVNAIAIASGGCHVCVIATGGGVKCWGLNVNGQLGVGDIANRNSPVDVPGARPYRRT
jgi:hypothetical protein